MSLSVTVGGAAEDDDLTEELETFTEELDFPLDAEVPLDPEVPALEEDEDLALEELLANLASQPSVQQKIPLL